MYIKFIFSSIEFKIFLTFFLLYSFFTQWNDIWDFNSSFSLTRAIVEENKFEIDSYHNTTEVKSYYNEHYYTPISPGISFLTTWIYWIGKKFNTSLLTYEFLMVVFSNSLFGALSTIVVFKILKFFTENEKHNLLTTLTYGLATSIFPYSLGFYVYIPAIFFLLMSFYFILREKLSHKNSIKNFLLCGIFFGIAYLTYPISILIIIPFFSYIFVINRKMTPFIVIGGLIGALPFFLYNYAIFGYFQFSPLKIFYYWVGKRASWELPEVNHLKILPRVLFYPWNGLFFYYPVLLISFIGILIMCIEKRLEGFFILIIFLLVLYYVVTFSRWWGDFSFGPRRFLLITPFLILGLPSILKRITLIIFYLLFIISLFNNFLGLQMWTSLDTIPEINKFYLDSVENFQIIRNPLLQDYLPAFIKNGPRSLLFENLLFNKKVSIRFVEEPNPKSALIIGSKFIEINKIKLVSLFPYFTISLKTPFLCLIPISVMIFLIWLNEIIHEMKNRRILNKQKIIISIILLIAFFFAFVDVSLY